MRLSGTLQHQPSLSAGPCACAGWRLRDESPRLSECDPGVSGVKVGTHYVFHVFYSPVTHSTAGRPRSMGKCTQSRVRRVESSAVRTQRWLLCEVYLHGRKRGAAGRHLLELCSHRGVRDVIQDTKALIINENLKRKHACFEGKRLTLPTTYGPLQTNGAQRLAI